MKMKKFITMMGATVLVWACGAHAQPGQHLDISVGDWPPFFIEGEPGQGSVARMVRDIFAEEGYTVTFHFRPWQRAYREAAIGNHHATAIWMYAPEREQDFTYSDPVMKELFVLFHRKDRPLEWDNLSDLSDLKIGTSFGYSYGPDFDTAVDNKLLSVDEAASTVLNFKKLLYGRIDAFPEEINVGYYILNRELSRSEVQQVTHHPKPILENESFLLFPKNEPETQHLVEIFNRQLAEFRNNGRYDDYFDVRPQASLSYDEDVPTP